MCNETTNTNTHFNIQKKKVFTSGFQEFPQYAITIDINTFTNKIWKIFSFYYEADIDRTDNYRTELELN